MEIFLPDCDAKLKVGDNRNKKAHESEEVTFKKLLQEMSALGNGRLTQFMCDGMGALDKSR